MKKSQLYSGISYTLLGLTCIVIAILTEFKLEGILWGLGGAGIGPGVALILQYLYWSRPDKLEEYTKRMKNVKIEMSDERKVMLRDKSGRITYQFMIYVYCALIVIITIVSSVTDFQPTSQGVVIGLSMLLLLQYICGIVVFNRLNNKL